MGLQTATSIGGHHDQDQSHIVDDNDDKQRKSCKLHWGIKRPQVQYQQQKLRWPFSCCKSRCAVPSKYRAAAAENQVGKQPLGIRIPTEPPPVTSEQHTVGLRQHPSGLSSGQGKQLLQLGGPAGTLRISIWRVCHRQHGIMMITVRLITSQP